MPLRQRLSRIFALIGATPLVLFATVTLAGELPHFIDPCFHFGETGGTIRISSNCRTRMAGTSETITGTLLRLALVQGSCMVAAFVGLIGAYRDKRTLVLLASLIAAALTAVLLIGNFGGVALLS